MSGIAAKMQAGVQELLEGDNEPNEERNTLNPNETWTSARGTATSLWSTIMIFDCCCQTFLTVTCLFYLPWTHTMM